MSNTLFAQLSAVAIAATTSLIATAPIVQAQPISASVDGRYEDLEQVLYCPQARGEYGSFNEYGYWEGGVVCDDEYGSAGYWVYDFPNWYIWNYDVDADSNYEDPTSAYGQYSGLVQVLTCYDDAAGYGDYSNYGYWEGGSWCGQYGEAGYWVYSYPDWYVWSYEN